MPHGLSMFKNILLPYDGSNPSDKALDYAIKFANDNKNNLLVTLLYVIPKIRLPPSYDYGLKLPTVKTSKEYLKELYQNMKSDALNMLEHRKNEFEARITESSRITLSTQVLYDRRNAAETILEFAKKEKSDLIIIGSTGLGGFSKIKALGRVSRMVSERAKCPVMIIH